MTSKDLTQTNSNDFYNNYCKREYWTKEEAVAMSFNIDPKKIKGSASSNLKDDEGRRYKKDFCLEYNLRFCQTQKNVRIEAKRKWR